MFNAYSNKQEIIMSYIMFTHSYRNIPSYWRLPLMSAEVVRIFYGSCSTDELLVIFLQDFNNTVKEKYKWCKKHVENWNWDIWQLAVDITNCYQSLHASCLETITTLVTSIFHSIFVFRSTNSKMKVRF